MRKTLFRLLFLPFVLFSCYEESADHMNIDEARVISPEKMESLLTDLFLVEGAVSYMADKGTPIDGYSKKYFEEVLEKHNVTRPEFEESIKYYTYHIEKLDKLFENVIVNLSELETKVIIEVEEEKEKDRE